MTRERFVEHHGDLPMLDLRLSGDEQLRVELVRMFFLEPYYTRGFTTFAYWWLNDYCSGMGAKPALDQLVYEARFSEVSVEAYDYKDKKWAPLWINAGGQKGKD